MLFISILQIMIITFDCQKYHPSFVKYFSPFSHFPKFVFALVLALVLERYSVSSRRSQ